MSKRSAYNIKKIVAVYDSDMLGVQAYHYYNDEGEEYPEVIYKFDLPRAVSIRIYQDPENTDRCDFEVKRLKEEIGYAEDAVDIYDKARRKSDDQLADEHIDALTRRAVDGDLYPN